jgi:murein DD-endopeptidase MepM/ murein hydrolase activator NlpD
MKVMYNKEGFVTLAIPVGTISAGYGSVDKVHSLPHTGIDYVVPMYTEIHAPASGIVTRVYENAKIGKAVIVKMMDGKQYVLGHLSETHVHVGKIVRKGELLALSGNSGHSTAPHLHFGLIDTNGKFLDPATVFNNVEDFSKFTDEGRNLPDVWHFVELVKEYVVAEIAINFVNCASIIEVIPITATAV